jgi:Mn2+/Fe2+ NRAMP family transporter
MAQARDPEALEREKAKLREIDARPGLFRRWRGYWNLTGPGWVQSALTLGAGSAGSSIYAGAVFGY